MTPRIDLHKPLPVSVVCLVSHDVDRLFESLESYYEYADEILFGIEKRNLAMSMQPIEIPEDFYHRIARYPKVELVREEFYTHDRSPIENDTHERNRLGAMTRPGNWVVQIDADEILMNPEDFFPWLARQPDDFLLVGRWVQLFKEVPDGDPDAGSRANGSAAAVADSGHRFLVVCDADGRSLGHETFPVATRRRGAYTCARYTRQKQRLSPLWALHYSWARPEAAVRRKMRTWGHSADFDQAAYLDFWRSVNASNYTDIVDFHPIVAGQWPRLACLSLEQVQAAVRRQTRRDTRLHRTVGRARRFATQLARRSRPVGGPSRFATGGRQ